MRFLQILVLVIWTTSRHEASHAFMAWLEGSEIQQLRIFPGYTEELGFFFGYVIHSGDTTWLTDAAPFLSDLLLVLITIALLSLIPQVRFKKEILFLGFISPLADLAYNYQGGFWREGTDVHDLFIALPDVWVHLYFLVSIIASFALFRKFR